MANIKLITSAEAAKILNITRQGLDYLVKKGEIKMMEVVDVPATITCKYRLFNKTAILEYRKERGQ